MPPMKLGFIWGYVMLLTSITCYIAGKPANGAAALGLCAFGVALGALAQGMERKDKS